MRQPGAGVFRANLARGFFAPTRRGDDAGFAGGMHPPFSFWRPKKRTGRARSKRKNAFAVGGYGRSPASLCPRRGADGGFGGLGHPLRRFPLVLSGSAGAASAGLGGQAFLRPPTLTGAGYTRGKPIRGTRPARGVGCAWVLEIPDTPCVDFRLRCPGAPGQHQRGQEDRLSFDLQR